MGYYSFNRPRRDGRLSWPCWLTDSGRLTHKVVTRPAISLVQDRECSPARTGVLTTMLRHQLMSVSQNRQIEYRSYTPNRLFSSKYMCDILLCGRGQVNMSCVCGHGQVNMLCVCVCGRGQVNMSCVCVWSWTGFCWFVITHGDTSDR